jgi:hypothetical protein
VCRGRTAQSTQLFEEETGRWYTLPRPMPTARRGLGLVEILR